MIFLNVLAAIVGHAHRHSRFVVGASALLAAVCALYASTHLGVSTDTNLMFPETLPWRRAQIAISRDFPQFNDLLVAVIDAKEPEEADATAAALAQALQADPVHFREVSRPDADPFWSREGLLFLDTNALGTLLDRIIDAQPFLGQLAADPSSRGLFGALALLGRGVELGQVDMKTIEPALQAFHETMAAALDGRPEPLSWARLIGGGTADLGGPYRFVLAQPRLDYGTLRPGGAAQDAMRAVAQSLPYVKSGDARVRITGSVALANDEFATVAEGMASGLVVSVALIALWLFFAVHTWRLIVPILLTLGLGLLLTLGFSAIAVGTLNLVSVGFGILFVGIAVDFAIQFCVRLREARKSQAELGAALTYTARRAGGQVAVAAAATSAGFLAFVPTDFRGVAELGLIAGVGMIIAFLCTITFLPAAITIFKPRRDSAPTVMQWGEPMDRLVRRWHRPLLAVFACIGVLGAILTPHLTFDADPLHTKDPDTEAVRTLYDLMASPVTNPFTIDIMAANAKEAAAIADRLQGLSLVDRVISINSFVPDDQAKKLAMIRDAQSLLAPTLAAPDMAMPPSPQQIRQAAAEALEPIERALPKIPPGHPLAAIADDLRRLRRADDGQANLVDEMLTRFLPKQLKQLTDALSAQPVTLDSLPPSIARDWVLPDGRARVQVVPKKEASSNEGLRRFVAEVLARAPNAGGSAVTIVATSETIVGAFQTAALTAVVGIALILLVSLRRPLDVGLVLAPLLLSALLTVAVAVLLPITLNYANIIALPVLLGVGVSFNVYFVMNWRAGRVRVLASATARAVLFSALTTGTAFGALALSAHPGTASMGVLLLTSLACTLVASLIFVPALLAALPRP
jgi:hopanoid biosynthesis associated RND transporter like protein HpnN